jgi:hypothetical protein
MSDQVRNQMNLRDGVVQFTINGQTIPADRARFLPPEQIENLCGLMRRQAIENGVATVYLDGSISPPGRRPRKPSVHFGAPRAGETDG